MWTKAAEGVIGGGKRLGQKPTGRLRWSSNFGSRQSSGGRAEGYAGIKLLEAELGFGGRGAWEVFCQLQGLKPR